MSGPTVITSNPAAVMLMSAGCIAAVSLIVPRREPWPWVYACCLTVLAVAVEVLAR